jgi:hypothetical protein
MSTMPTSDWIRGNVLGLAAIFLALSGTAYATHPGGANTISSTDIINGEVRNDDLAANAVGSGKIADRQVKNADLSIGASSSNTIADGGIQGVDVRNETLTTEKLADLAVTIPKLAFDPATQSELNAHKNSTDHDDEYWTLQGNKGTVAGKQFLGTLDGEPLELWVNSARALRLEPASDGTNQSPNVIGGIADNFVTAGVHSATIGGGGRSTPTDPASANRVTDSFGTIGGGADNRAGNDAGTTEDRRFATVGGGESNVASASHDTVGGGLDNFAGGSDSTVGGGRQNLVSGHTAVVAGGWLNEATGVASTVSGGFGNDAAGTEATVPGGSGSEANGAFSFAAGSAALAEHDGAWVWADGTGFSGFASTADNEFAVRASGGVRLRTSANLSTGCNLPAGSGTFACTSDRRAKRGFEAVDERRLLDALAGLPIQSWQYRSDPERTRHVGPTAQDFARAFGLGADRKTISTVDADGVALAAIKGLNAVVEEQERRIGRLEARLAAIAQGSR